MQLWVACFVRDWMKFRVPSLINHFSSISGAGDKLPPQDLVHLEIGIAKELEILEIIFNGDNEFYNYRISKNTLEIEKALSE
jgi:hypothetical protein